MFDQLEIVSLDGEVQFVDLDPAVGILNIGRHPDNDLVLNGADIQPFHALLDYRQTPYQVLFLGDDGANRTATEFDPWRTLHIGDYELVLVHAGEGTNRVAAAETDRPKPAPQQNLGKSPQPVHPLPIQNANNANRMVQYLTVHNSGDQAATFQIDVQGIDPGWVDLSASEVFLRPGEQTQIQIGLNPGLEPGPQQLSWHIVSPQYPGWAQSGVLSLALPAAPAIQWGELRPKEIRSQPFRRTGSGQLSLTNAGHEPVNYQLWAKDLRGECHIELVPSGRAPSAAKALSHGAGAVLLSLPPGETVVQIRLRPKSGGILGIRNLRHRFVVQGHLGPNSAVHSVSGVFEQRPLINTGWLFLLLTLFFLVAVVLYRDELLSWLDGWRYPLFSAVVSATPTPLPELIHGFSAEELARYRRPAPAVSGQGGREDTGPEIGANLTYEEIFRLAGRQYNLDWRLLASLSYRESLLNPKARGGSGEYGLMQILPTTWNEWAPLVEVTDPWDPYSNIMVGAAYFSYIHGYFISQGYADPRWALAAYNWGPERVLQIMDRNGGWQEIPLPQQQYVADILLGIDKAQGRVQAADSARLSLIGAAPAVQ